MTSSKTRSLAQRSSAVAMGILLVCASLLNLWADTRHPRPPHQSGLSSPVVSLATAAVEALLGLLLFTGLRPRDTWHAGISVFSLFAIITAMEAAKGKVSCGCFGAVQVRPIHTMALDLFAVAMLLLTGRPTKGSIKPQARRYVIAFGIAFCWLTAVILFWQTRPAIARATGQDFGKAGALVVLEPEKWAGQRFALADHIEVGSQLERGAWTVLLVYHDCRHCAAAVPQYVSASLAASTGSRLAVIEMPPYSDADDPPPWELPPTVLSGHLDQTRDWFVTAPVILVIKDGIVVSANAGDPAETQDQISPQPSTSSN